MNLVDEGYQIVKKDLLRNIPVVITVTNMARFKSHFRLKCLKFSLDVDFFKDTGTIAYISFDLQTCMSYKLSTD